MESRVDVNALRLSDSADASEFLGGPQEVTGLYLNPACGGENNCMRCMHQVKHLRMR